METAAGAAVVTGTEVDTGEAGEEGTDGAVMEAAVAWAAVPEAV